MSRAPRPLAHAWFEDVLGIAIGAVVVSFGVSLIAAAGGATGGTAGIALLVSYGTGWPLGLLFAIVNLPFIVLAARRKGAAFTLRTLASLLAVSALTELHRSQVVFAELGTVYGILLGNLLVGIGLLLLFRHGSSVGGVNVVALLVQERSGFPAGYVQMAIDVVIVAAAFTMLPWPIVLLSAGGAVLLNLVLAMNHRPDRYVVS